MRGVTLARTDSTPVVTDLSGTRMDPLDRAPLRQRIVSIVLSAPSQGSSCSAPPPVPLIAWWSPPHIPSSPLACMHAFSFGRRLRFSNRNLDGVASPYGVALRQPASSCARSPPTPEKAILLPRAPAEFGPRSHALAATSPAWPPPPAPPAVDRLLLRFAPWSAPQSFHIDCGPSSIAVWLRAARRGHALRYPR